MSVQTILDSATSAASTGNWFATNFNYRDSEILTVFASINATAAGDFRIDVSPDQNIIVSAVPLPTGTSYLTLQGNFPYVRAVKAANTLGGKVILVEK